MGRYAPAELDRTRAYQVLAHAEIEAYIEDLSLQAAIDMTSRWKADGVPRATIAALLHRAARTSRLCLRTDRSRNKSEGPR